MNIINAGATGWNMKTRPLAKKVTGYGFVPKMSKTQPRVWRGAPAMGQDTRAILKTIAGYTDQEIDAFKELGIIAPKPKAAVPA